MAALHQTLNPAELPANNRCHRESTAGSNVEKLGLQGLLWGLAGVMRLALARCAATWTELSTISDADKV